MLNHAFVLEIEEIVNTKGIVKMPEVLGIDIVGVSRGNITLERKEQHMQWSIEKS